MSVGGGAGRPPERAGRTGTSDTLLEDGVSTDAVIPRPAFNWAVAAAADVDRSGWLKVGVVGEPPPDLSFWERGAEVLILGLSESPRAGRSRTTLEPKDDSEVSGESCEPMGGEEVKVESMNERLCREGVAVLEVLRCCCG